MPGIAVLRRREACASPGKASASLSHCTHNYKSALFPHIHDSAAQVHRPHLMHALLKKSCPMLVAVIATVLEAGVTQTCLICSLALVLHAQGSCSSGKGARLLCSVLGTLLTCFGLLLHTLHLLQSAPVAAMYIAMQPGRQGTS